MIVELDRGISTDNSRDLLVKIAIKSQHYPGDRIFISEKERNVQIVKERLWILSDFVCVMI